MLSLAEVPGLLIERRYLKLLLASSADRAQVRTSGRQLREANAAFVSDRGTVPHIRVAAAVLASYRLLRERGIAEDGAIERIKDALVNAYRGYLRGPIKVLLTLLRHRFGAFIVRHLNEANQRRFFGGKFVFGRNERGPVAELVVHSCLYHAFFSINSAPELTQVICHSDLAWIELIQPRYGLDFDRPSTIGTGGEQCIFRFISHKPRGVSQRVD